MSVCKTYFLMWSGDNVFFPKRLTILYRCVRAIQRYKFTPPTSCSFYGQSDLFWSFSSISDMSLKTNVLLHFSGLKLLCKLLCILQIIVKKRFQNFFVKLFFWESILYFNSINWWTATWVIHLLPNWHCNTIKVSVAL